MTRSQQDLIELIHRYATVTAQMIVNNHLEFGHPIDRAKEISLNELREMLETDASEGKL